MNYNSVKFWRLLIPVIIGLTIWLYPPPQGVTHQAWHLLAIFVATIVGIIAKPLPMGAVAMIGIALTALTGTLSINQALSGFSNRVIWLIVSAFLIARGFIKTGLGSRIAYMFVSVFGKKTLGLGYSMVATDCILAPAIPSNTARAGGVIFPIIRSLSHSFGSEPDDGTERKIGAFLIKNSFQGTVITSAMFMTAMAANPLAAKLAGDMNIEVTWGGWALGGIVPGLCSLIVIPWLIYKLYPPEIKETPEAPQLAKEKLEEMGPVTTHEWLMLGVFVLLLILWIFGKPLGIHSTTAALVGLGILLITGVLTWGDVEQERKAWDTLVWFAALVMMATMLNKLGFIPWFSNQMGGAVKGMHWATAHLALVLVYFYIHYMFASQTAHISAMYAPFLVVSLAAGTPPLFAALTLGYASNLFASMTHYGTGPAPVLFGPAYVDIGTWWKLGFLISVVNIIIWLVIGGIWWKVLGYW